MNHNLTKFVFDLQIFSLKKKFSSFQLLLLLFFISKIKKIFIDQNKILTKLILMDHDKLMNHNNIRYYAMFSIAK